MARTSCRREHKYFLEDRSEEDISPLWQMLQILFYAFCVVLGFGLCYSFSCVMVTMNHNCLLYSRIGFYQPYDSDMSTFDIKLLNSEFKDGSCNFITFVPIITTVPAAFLIVLFCISGRGGRGNDIVPEAWRLVIPVLIINMICFCTSLYLANIFHKGLKGFLDVIASFMKKEKIHLVNLEKLRLEGVQIGSELIKYLTMTKHVMWMMVSFWGLSFFWTFLRCIFIVDFQLVCTSIHMYPKTSLYLQKPLSTVEESVESNNYESKSTSLKSPSSSNSIHQRSVSFAPNIEVVTSPKVIPKYNEVSTPIDEIVEEHTELEIPSNSGLNKKA